mgnify:CR=1 FL=1
MSAIAPIAILDGAATPVTHTFAPVASDPDAIYRESIAGLSLIGQASISLRFLTPLSATLQKVRLELVIPSLEVASGQNSQGYTAAPKKAYDEKITMDFFLPSRGTSTSRKNLRVLAANLLANTQVIDAIENLNRPY